MIAFLWKYLLFLLPLPLLFGILRSKRDNKDDKALRVPFYQELKNIKPGMFGGRTSLGMLKMLVWAVWICLVIAASRPAYIGEPIEEKQDNRIIMLLIDASGSMSERDFALGDRYVPRFFASKQIVSEFIKKREGDKIGIVFFGTLAYLYVPPTDDLKTLLEMFASTQVGLAGENTAIGDSIGVAVKAVKDIEAKHRVAILLSDGESNAGTLHNPEAIELAKSVDLKIYTIGIGGSYRQAFGGIIGSMMPKSMLQNFNMDESSLKEIAMQTGGVYYRADDAKTLDDVYGEIDKLEKKSSKGRMFYPITDLFYISLAAAFLISLCFFIMRRR